jgi:hypothetical protein
MKAGTMTRRGALCALATAAAAPALALPAPADPVFGLIEAHKQASLDHSAALVEQARLERIGDIAAAWASETGCHAEFEAFDALLSGASTTLPGIRAKLAYLQAIAASDSWMFSDREDAAMRLLESFAATVANISEKPCA